MNYSDYSNPSHEYLWSALERILEKHALSAVRAIDIGCGFGAISARLARLGHDVTGIDSAEQCIRIARENFPEPDFHIGSCYDDLAAAFGTFDLVVGLEVIEHLYDPLRFSSVFRELLKPGGIGIISTPYHGYLKNLVIATMDRSDAHFQVNKTGGHVKFFSRSSLEETFQRAGLEPIEFHRLGRIPALAKSMMSVVRRDDSKVA